MQIIYEYGAGIDIHKKMVVGCLIMLHAAGQRVKEIRSFRTTTAGLLELRDWLHTAGCTHVAMESTGVYWRPVWNLLEDAFEVLLVNAQHLKAVAGRKTDVRDAEWIADLLQHGLLTGSFLPPTEQRELRDLTRYRARGGRSRACGQSASEGAGRHEYQTGRWCYRHHWPVCSHDVACMTGWANRSR